MKLCQDAVGAKLMGIARVFQVGHYSTVSQMIGRLNRLVSVDPELEKEFNVLSQDLPPLITLYFRRLRTIILG
jgi:hypothetical protein